jgi:ABC-2 type transport system permease protein
MHGLKAIFKKELADHFSSYRFMILFALITMVSLIIAYMVGLSIKEELASVAKPKYVFLMLFTSRGALFSLVQFIAFFGPLIGLILGFDMINRERNEGTLSRLLSQPVYRDSVINGKFLAGVVTISIMMISIVLLITGLGLRMAGVVPGFDEAWRIVVYLIISIVYISFWLGVAILFSIIFRGIATSALAALAVWIFFSFFVSLGATVMADALVPEASPSKPDTIIKHAKIQRAFSLASPMNLYTDATGTIIDPTRKTTRTVVLMGPLEKLSQERFSGPLTLGLSIFVVMPYIILLIAITAICFAISYTIFMRQEIRSL